MKGCWLLPPVDDLQPFLHKDRLFGTLSSNGSMLVTLVAHSSSGFQADTLISAAHR